jgi:hypothetical protein
MRLAVALALYDEQLPSGYGRETLRREGLI